MNALQPPKLQEVLLFLGKQTYTSATNTTTRLLESKTPKTVYLYDFKSPKESFGYSDIYEWS